MSETPRKLTITDAAIIMSGSDQFSHTARSARFRQITGGLAVCSFCGASCGRIADWLPQYHICESCFSTALKCADVIAASRRELSAAQAQIAAAEEKRREDVRKCAEIVNGTTALTGNQSIAAHNAIYAAVCAIRAAFPEVFS